MDHAFSSSITTVHMSDVVTLDVTIYGIVGTSWLIVEPPTKQNF